MVAFSLWPIDVHRYGLFYLLGFIGGYLFLRFLAKKKIFSQYPKLQKLLEKQLDDLLIVLIVGVIIGWRAGHVLIYDLPYFKAHPLDIFAIRKGGMSFIWGMLGCLLGIMFLKYRKKLTRDEFRLLLDALVAIVPLGIMFWRIGNFLNQELYGIIAEPNQRWLSTQITELLKTIHLLHVYPQVGPELRINTNFLASFFEGLVPLILLVSLTRKRIKSKIMKPGFLVGVFLCCYSGVRFMLEYIRQDSQFEFIGPFSKSQWFFVAFFLVGMYLLLRSKKKK